MVAYAYALDHKWIQTLVAVCTPPLTISPLLVAGHQHLALVPIAPFLQRHRNVQTRELDSVIQQWYVLFKRLCLPPFILLLQAAQELDQKIQEVYKRIQTERKILEATQILRQATPNPDVLRMNEAKIKETERSLLYFENTLKELQSRKLQLAGHDPTRSPNSGLPSSPKQTRHDRDRSLPPTPPTYGNNENNRQQGADASVIPKTKQYSNLDLIKADTPHTTAKISKMLHQLEFKLQVEKQYKEGIAKMSSLYQADGDKKSRADAEFKKVESDRKILLLQSALKRYKNLHILDEADDDDQAGTLQKWFYCLYATQN